VVSEVGTCTFRFQDGKNDLRNLKVLWRVLHVAAAGLILIESSTLGVASIGIPCVFYPRATTSEANFRSESSIVHGGRKKVSRASDKLRPDDRFLDQMADL